MARKLVSSGKGIHSQGFYERKRRRIRALRIIFSVAAVLFLLALIYILRSETLRITDIRVTGGEVMEAGEIIAEVRHRLDESYFWLIPKSNAFFYPRKTITAALYDEFPRFKSVGLDLESLNTLIVRIEEREPFALYCREIPAVNRTSECYFLDENGLIFALAPSFSGDVYFVYTAPETIENPLGRELVPTEEFKLLPTFIGSLSSLNLRPLALEVSPAEYTLFLASGARIMWRRESNLGLIRSNLETFLKSDPIRTLNGFLESVEYLDLRTENKVFYKFK